MKRIICIFLILIMMLSATACGGKQKNIEYDEAEVKEAARLLIARSDEFNNIFLGEGIGYIEDINTSNGAYHAADPADLAKYGFETLEELKKLTLEVFSERCFKAIFSTSLSSYGDDEGIYGLTRYYQKYSDAYGREPECIMVYENPNILLKDEVVYLLDSIEVTHSDKDRVWVNISADVTRDDKTQKIEISVGLTEERGGWKIDTPTYMSYNETKK